MPITTKVDISILHHGGVFSIQLNVTTFVNNRSVALSGYVERGVNKTHEFKLEFPYRNMFGLIWDTGV
jgi:hypothetical protein